MTEDRKDILKWKRMLDEMNEEVNENEMMYCPSCGWKGKRSELKNGKCPKCGANVIPLSKKKNEEYEMGGDKDEEEKEDKNMKEKGTKKPSEKDVISFLKDNPNPDDDNVHDWANENGYEIHGLETIIYKLATKYVKSLDKEED